MIVLPPPQKSPPTSFPLKKCPTLPEQDLDLWYTQRKIFQREVYPMGKIVLVIIKMCIFLDSLLKTITEILKYLNG